MDNKIVKNNVIIEDILQVKKCENPEKITRKELNKIY